MTHIAHTLRDRAALMGDVFSSRASMCFCVTHNAHAAKGQTRSASVTLFASGVGWGWGVEGREARDCDWHLPQTIFCKIF